MRFAQYQDWPYCGRYLINWLDPDVLKKKVPKTWNAFVRWCGDEQTAKTACTWSKGPLVEINNEWMDKNTRPTANGATPLGTNMCYIREEVASKYERGTGWIVWESTVLHELVHWARHAKGLSRHPNGLEPGREFEIEAYGHDIDRGEPWRAGP